MVHILCKSDITSAARNRIMKRKKAMI